jgi:hypothetical protein
MTPRRHCTFYDTRSLAVWADWEQYQDASACVSLDECRQSNMPHQSTSHGNMSRSCQTHQTHPSNCAKQLDNHAIAHASKHGGIGWEPSCSHCYMVDAVPLRSHERATGCPANLLDHALAAWAAGSVGNSQPRVLQSSYWASQPKALQTDAQAVCTSAPQATCTPLFASGLNLAMSTAFLM